MHKTRTIGQKLKPQQRESHGRLLQSVHFFFLAAYVSLVYTHLLLASLSKDRYTNGLLIRSDSSIDTFYVCVYGPQSLLCTVLWIIHYRGKKLAGYIRWWIYSVNGVSLSLCIYMCKVPKETQGAHSISMSVCVVYVCRTRPSLSQSSCTDEKKANKKKIKKK